MNHNNDVVITMMSFVQETCSYSSANVDRDHSAERIHQILVRLNGFTHVIQVPLVNSLEQCRLYVLAQCSHRTGWAVRSLCITDWSPPFCSVRSVSCIRGGKGGFGTLLKGQSKQAGAKMTTDFGACRDLQGRRLRHVNDEIKLRRWRELQQRKAAGENVDELSEMLQTPTGLYNWYLLTPNWAGLSGKGTRKVQRQLKRQFRQWQSEEEQAKEAKRLKEEEYQQSVAYYVNETMTVADRIQKSTADAVLKGMVAAKKQRLEQQQQQQAREKRKEKLSSAENSKQDPTDSNAEVPSDDQQPQSLLTLSGDVVIEKSEGNPIRIQSKSDFATMAFVLDNDNPEQSSLLYYEVKLVTAGLAQVGWAAMMNKDFRPNSENGDGVGDDAGSFGYDGSRGLKFHNGTEQAYGSTTLWRSGDVVGCLYDATTGQISFCVNGTELGIAFTVTTACRPLVPAISCNKDEILELRFHENETQYQPTGTVPVGNLLSSTQDVNGKEQILADPPITGDSSVGQSLEPSEHKTQGEEDTREASSNGVRSAQLTDKCDENINKGKPENEVKPPASTDPVKAEPLDMQKFSSPRELEELGLDRLKAALMALGVKCGGSLEERAERLFSLKGLERDAYPKKVLANNKKKR